MSNRAIRNLAVLVALIAALSMPRVLFAEEQKASGMYETAIEIDAPEAKVVQGDSDGLTQVPDGGTRESNGAITESEAMPAVDAMHASATGDSASVEEVTSQHGGQSHGEEFALTSAATGPRVSVEVHVQQDGWKEAVKDGSPAGTTGRSLRLESLRMRLEGLPENVTGGIRYRVHVQRNGWQDWCADGEQAGTEGLSLRLEAAQIELTGNAAEEYDVWYRVHAQSLGWMGWAKNGETSGTAGMAKRLESVQVVVLPKGSPAPVAEDQSYDEAFAGAEEVRLQAHVQHDGWQDWAVGGQISGTTGRSLRVESLRAELSGTRVPGSVELLGHVQKIGWGESWGPSCGTEGQSLRLEAVRMRLVGEAAEVYDLYYRAHVQRIGWMGWCKDGEPIGTQGLGARVEAFQTKLVSKGDPAPAEDGQSVSVPFVSNESLEFRTLAAGGPWNDWLESGVSGQEGGPAIVGMQARVDGDLSGDVVYSIHVSKEGWLSDVRGDAVAQGVQGGNIEAFTASLTGDVSKAYNIWYRGYVSGKGWMGWTKNGAQAGSIGCSLPLEAIELRLVPATYGAPGPTERPLYAKPSINIIQDIHPEFIHGEKPAEYQKYIVMHDTEGIGAPQNVVAGWVAAGRFVAAHFVIGLDGTIVQCIPIDKIGHHATHGNKGHNEKFGTPEDGRDDLRGVSSWAVPADIGLNSYAIGIEMVHVGASHDDYPAAQLDALDALIAYIDDYYGFQSQIIQHKDWAEGNSDCSDEFQQYLRNLQETRRTRR